MNSELKKQLVDSNLFRMVEYENTKISIFDLLDLNGEYTGYYIVGREYGDFPLSWVCEKNKKHIFLLSFEEVLDKVNDELKEKLLFHLDILKWIF